MGETVDENAISLSMRDLGFPVRVLVARALPPETASVRNLAQIVAQQADNWDGLTLVATTDDAHMALFASFLKPDDAREIEAKSAQTWTQQGVAVGVAQTLRLVSSQRKLQRQSWFLRIVLPTIIGVSCLFAALFSWIRRKLKHHARRKISKNLPTTIPITDEIGSEA